MIGTLKNVVLANKLKITRIVGSRFVQTGAKPGQQLSYEKIQGFHDKVKFNKDWCMYVKLTGEKEKRILTQEQKETFRFIGSKDLKAYDKKVLKSLNYYGETSEIKYSSFNLRMEGMISPVNDHLACLYRDMLPYNRRNLFENIPRYEAWTELLELEIDFQPYKLFRDGNFHALKRKLFEALPGWERTYLNEAKQIKPAKVKPRSMLGTWISFECDFLTRMIGAYVCKQHPDPVIMVEHLPINYKWSKLLTEEECKEHGLIQDELPLIGLTASASIHINKELAVKFREFDLAGENARLYDLLQDMEGVDRRSQNYDRQQFEGMHPEHKVQGYERPSATFDERGIDEKAYLFHMSTCTILPKPVMKEMPLLWKP